MSKTTEYVLDLRAKQLVDPDSLTELERQTLAILHNQGVFSLNATKTVQRKKQQVKANTAPILRYLHLKQEKAAIEQEINDLRKQFLSELDEGKTTIGNYELTVATVGRTSYDWKQMPPSTLERIQRYRKDSEAKRLTVKVLP